MDRKLWSQQEDEQIVKLVNRYGTKKWPTISEKLCAETEYQRTGKQCRQRWYNHLSPEINTSRWSEKDEDQLFQAHKTYGNKWKCISMMFTGRTDNSIKNHFYSTIRRCLRRINKLQGQKNSTLKMRSIKPYVLSKILEDRKLTESILALGKIKPSKNNKQIKAEYFEEFNQMIVKLYQINSEYEEVKLKKKSKGEGPAQIDSEQVKLVSGEKVETVFQRISNQLSEESNLSATNKRRQSFERIRESCDHSQNQIITKISTNKIRRIIKKRKNHQKNNLLESRELLKKAQIMSSKVQTPFKRQRKSINYIKLNEGILCENERHQIDETNHESEVSKRKIQSFPSVELMNFDGEMNDNNLQQIEQEQQKSNQKQQIFMNHNVFSQDFMDMRPLNSIVNPSPCYDKSRVNFNELIVIGTHLKIFPTPLFSSQKKAENLQINEQQRKQSQDYFIQQILQINFDPDYVLRQHPQEQ